MVRSELEGSPRRVLGLIRKRLRAEAGEGLSSYLRQVSGRARAAGDLDLGEDADVRRFLGRFGWLGAGASAERVREAVRDLAREASEEELAVGLLLRIFASGDRAAGVEAVCGEMPRCQGCELSGSCRHLRSEAGEPPPARSERPAVRLRREGEEALTASELAALVFCGQGLPEKRALALARRLLGRSGSLRLLAAMDLKELAAVEGMSDDLALRLRAALALAGRYSVERREPGRAFRGGRDFLDFFWPLLRDLKQESFHVVLLDQKNRLLGSSRISVGGLTEALVHPREVFRPAIREAAAAVAFVHNHPSGSPQPSRDDREITARLLEVAKLVGVRVLDHVIVGDGEYFSFAEEGLL